ncbi:MAG: ATP-dependent helicase [Anaerolineales bacterium]
MQIHKWIKELEKNDKQAEALYKSGNTVVIAGPGSGKTRVLTTKIAKLLLDEIRAPQGIVCLTYTRMMAKEIEERLYSLGIQDRPNIFVGTVHSFCLSHIVSPYAKLFGMNVPEPIRIAPKELISKTQLLALKTYFKVISKETFDQFRLLRQLRVDIRVNDWTDFKEYGRAIIDYEKRLIGDGFLDFDLVIKIGLRLIMSQELVRDSLYAKFPWMAVDEYQDLGYPLYRIVTEMINKTPTQLVAIGDPNQSIFDFAGTDPKYLYELSMREDAQPIVTLVQNYRSAQEIIKIGDAILSKNTETSSEISGGQCTIIQCKSFDQQIAKSIEICNELKSKNIKPDDIAILHRKRNNLNRIANSLAQIDIEYTLDKHQQYDRSMGIIKWLEDLAFWSLAGWKTSSANRYTLDDLLNFWLELGANDQVHFNQDENPARIYFTSVLWEIKNPDELMVDWLKNIYEKLSLASLLEKYSALYPDEVSEFLKLVKVCQKGNPLDKLTIRKFSNLDPSIQLTTLHSSKGTEYNSVIITGVEEFSSNENEKRVLYVGATRARTNLYLLYTSQGTRLPKYIESIKKRASSENWSFVNFI